MTTTARPKWIADDKPGARPIGSRCTPDCVAPSPAQAHCSVCHLTFGGVTNFDRHREDGRCLDPATLDLVERDGVWRTPMTDEARAALRGESSQGGA